MSLYRNIHAKRKRIKAGSKERMNKVGTKNAPTAKAFKLAAKTAKKTKKKRVWILMVGVERFELPTLWSQTKCATRLRYTPNIGFIL